MGPFRPKIIFLFFMNKTCRRWQREDQKRLLCDQSLLPTGGLEWQEKKDTDEQRER